MKKITATGLILLLMVVYYPLAGAYKFEIYDAVIRFEEGLSELQVKTANISIGDISYYENLQPIDKPTVLMVHGFGAYKENWLRFARPFKDDFHVVVVDLPGHGKSVHSLDLSYSLDNQVRWLNEFAAAIGLGRFHLVGNSMGGAITVGYSATYPKQVISANLFAPGGVTDHRAVMQDYLDKGVNPLVLDDPSNFGKLMAFALEQPPFIPWPLTEVSALRALALKPVHEKVWLDIKADIAQDFKQKLELITAPTLIQWGKQDKVINYKNIEVFTALIPHAKGHVWQDVGHAPMIEIPKQAAKMMIDHIQSL